jgi:hypothetical protein
LFEFIEFLRVVAIGFISLILFGITFCKSVFYIEASWILMISTLLGLIIQPFLRAYHPFRSDVKSVIKHVENYINEVIPQEEKTYSASDAKLENALARAIYEYCIRTFPSAATYTSRVNEQIRFFYFYYFISIALKISSFCIILGVLIKTVNIYTNLLQFSPFIAIIIKSEFLMGINSIVYLAFVSISYVAISLLLARRFYITAKGIILNELDARHVFLLDQKQKIQELAKSAQKDKILMDLFKKAVDKEKGTRINR